MKIVCLVKFVPDTDSFVYDYDKNILVRESMELILNPDDSSALSYALKLKKTRDDVFVEIVSMGPLNIVNQLKDILRLHFDKAVLISDKIFSGSDTYATAKIISKYLSSIDYDIILCGSRSLDGGTQHIPSQVAVLLGDLPEMSDVFDFTELNVEKKYIVVKCDCEESVVDYKIKLPAVLGVQ
jgi:electron transfer flavoprotein beta subunit